MKKVNYERNAALRLWRAEVCQLIALQRTGGDSLDKQRLIVEAARLEYERAHNTYFELRAALGADEPAMREGLNIRATSRFNAV